MWIHVPTTCCHCVPASVDLTSDLHSERLAEIAQSVTLNGKHTHARYWQNAWRKKPWMKHLYGLTYTHSMAAHGAVSWIQSVAATRANRSAPPENDMVQMIRATYGRQLFESLKKSNRELCFSKMCRDISHSDSIRFAKIWNDWVSTLRRVCSARRKSARRMNANGCSSSGWPTVTAGAPEARALTGAPRGTRKNPTIMDAVQQWHTPRASMAGNENPTTFVTRNADRWPTPCQTDHKGSMKLGQRKGQLSEATEVKFHCSHQARKISDNGNESSATTPIARPRLNPNFTEWLMGFPIGWTDCAHAETPCSHWWPRMRSRLCFLLSQQIRDDIDQTLFDD